MIPWFMSLERQEKEMDGQWSAREGETKSITLQCQVKHKTSQNADVTVHDSPVSICLPYFAVALWLFWGKRWATYCSSPVDGVTLSNWKLIGVAPKHVVVGVSRRCNFASRRGMEIWDRDVLRVRQKSHRKGVDGASMANTHTSTH